MKKKIGSIIAVAIISVLFWISLFPWLKAGAGFGDIYAWLPPLLGICVLGAFISVSLILIEEVAWWIAISLVSAMPILMFGANPYYLFFLVALMFGIWFTARDIRVEIHERLKISVRGIVGRHMRYLLVPLMLGVSLAYFYSPQLHEKVKGGFISQSVQQSSIDAIKNYVLTPEVFQLQNNSGSGSSIEDKAKLALGLFNEKLSPFLKYLPALYAFGLFLGLWSIGFILVWLSTLMARALFGLLLKTRFVIIEEVDVKAERIKL